MPEPVAPRFPTPPVVGLLASVTPLVEPDLHWAGGMGFSISPAACDGGGVEDPCDVIARVAPDRGAEYTGHAFGVWGSDRCSTLDYGGNFAELRDRARRALEATQSKRIAEELWTGEQAIASGWDNFYLTHLNSDVLTAGATTPVAGLACLEQYLGQCSGGTPGMIHASRQVATYWASEDLISREGGLLVTKLGTVVVVDAGYDGSGPQGGADQPPTPPADGSIWAYASSMLQVILGPIDVTPDTPDGLQYVIDRELNDYVLFASRLAGITYDNCCHAAVELDLPLCGIGGAGS